MTNFKNLTIKAALITGVVFVAHYFSDFLEQRVVAGEPLAWIWLFLWYAVFIAAGLYVLDKGVVKS